LPSPHEHRTVSIAPEKSMEGLSHRARASLRLTEQGQVLLKNGKPDDAIGMLERAINLDSNNGLNYYYLSEAWLYKGKFERAEEFNALAEIYVKESPEWMVRVMKQRERIAELIR